MKVGKNIFLFIMALISSFVMISRIDKSGLIFSVRDTSMILYSLLSIFIFVFYKKYAFKSSKKLLNISAILFSLFMVIGYSFDTTNSSYLIIGNFLMFFLSVVKFIGYFYFFKVGLNFLYDFINNYKVKDLKKDNKLILYFKKHPYLFCFIVLFICYIPYVIAYYPVVINYDAANQIKEVMGIHTRYMDSVVLLNENVFITNFNPVLHTLLIGGCFKLGYLLGSVNFGLFLYSVIQVFIVIFTLSYAVYFMYKNNISVKVCLISLLIFGFVPVFPMYAMTGVKDVIFSCLVLLIVLKMYDFIKHNQNIKDYIYFAIITLFMMLFRNNGLYIVLLSYPVLICILKDKRISLIVVTLSSLLLYFGYTNVLLPYFDITNTSIREALSIPFQQTARYAKYYDEEIELSDKAIIDKVLGYETLADRYDPNLSDDVKNKYNKYTTSEELKNYFIVWFKYLLKRPNVYIDATLNNVYGYFYPNTSKWYVYNDYNTKLAEAGFNYHFNGLNILRDGLSLFSNAFPYIPFLGLIVNIGFTTWIYIFMLFSLIVSKKRKFLVMLLPGFVLLLTCVAGPANTYFRYILPLTFTLPCLIPILIKEIKKN